MLGIVTSIYSLFLKELHSEYKSRYSTNSIFLFVLTTVTIFLFSTANQKLNESILSAFYWIIMFFASMTGLSRLYISEVEKGTNLLLKLIANSTTIYFGKYLYSLILSLLINTLIAILMLLFIDKFIIRNYLIFIPTVLVTIVSFSSITSLLSALLSKANAKNALFPILSFPVMLPIIILGTESLKLALEGWEFEQAKNNIILMSAYCGIISTLSYYLFEIVWEE